MLEIAAPLLIKGNSTQKVNSILTVTHSQKKGVICVKYLHCMIFSVYIRHRATMKG